MHKNLRRSVVALAATLACFAVLASPASAATSIHTVAITGGTVTAVSTTSQVITSTLGGTTHTGCSTTSAVTIDTAGTANITTFSSVGTFILGGVHYVATMTRTASTSGAYSGGGITSVGISISVQIRRAVVQTSTLSDCAAETTVLCTLRSTLTFGGTYTGTPSTAGSTTFTSSSGASAITLGIGTCQVPFATFNGGTATVTGLTGTF